jgi:hypothetical protein
MMSWKNDAVVVDSLDDERKLQNLWLLLLLSSSVAIRKVVGIGSVEPSYQSLFSNNKRSLLVAVTRLSFRVMSKQGQILFGLRFSGFRAKCVTSFLDFWIERSSEQPNYRYVPIPRNDNKA